MEKPTTAVAWATDANYDAPAEAYDGTPTKVDPDTDAEQGHIPAIKPTAQKFNYWQNSVGNHVTYLEDAVSNLARRREWYELVPNDGGEFVTPSTPGYDPSTSPFVFALTPGSAYPRQGTTNNKIRISKGTLIQCASGMMLPYEVTEAEAEITIANAAGAVPRVDLIAVKIELDLLAAVPGLATKITFSHVVGTPNATPQVPATPAGFVAYCTVLVGASYAAAAGFSFDDTAGAVAVIHDQRMPLGVRSHTVMPSAMNYTLDANGWAITNQQLLSGGTAAAQSDVHARVPDEGAGRVLAVAAVMDDPGPANTFTVRLAKFSNSSLGNATTNLNGANPMQVFVNTDVRRRVAHRTTIDLSHTPAAGPTIAANAAGTIGAPVWSNGRRSWTESHAGATHFTCSHAALKFTAALTAAQSIFLAQIWTAGR